MHALDREGQLAWQIELDEKDSRQSREAQPNRPGEQREGFIGPSQVRPVNGCASGFQAHERDGRRGGSCDGLSK